MYDHVAVVRDLESWFILVLVHLYTCCSKMPYLRIEMHCLCVDDLGFVWMVVGGFCGVLCGLMICVSGGVLGGLNVTRMWLFVVGSNRPETWQFRAVRVQFFVGRRV